MNILTKEQEHLIDNTSKEYIEYIEKTLINENNKKFVKLFDNNTNYNLYIKRLIVDKIVEILNKKYPNKFYEYTNESIHYDFILNGFDTDYFIGKNN